ncbi:B-cell lymphoma 3 protein [Branchiostoma belcheri]|nr:B-cell lymphoma 3 protein [Branchiostoma belcheri]
MSAQTMPCLHDLYTLYYPDYPYFHQQWAMFYPTGAEEARPPPVHTVPSTLGRPHVPVPLSLPVPNFVDQRLGVFAPAELQQLSWQDEDGDTPLHIAVAQANVPLTERYLTLLAMAHRNIDIYNHLRQTPLHLAVITEQWPLVRMLVLSGACADVQDRNGQTAVHLSCQTASTACLHTILTCTTRELDLELRNYDGLTPLHVAVNTGNQDVAMLLVDSGADVDATDGKSGRTALFHAVERDQEDMVLYLLRAGAKVNAQCYAGNTPLHAASGRGQQNMVKLLIKHGADIGVKNSHNDTPLAVVKTRVISQMMRGRYKPQPPNAASAPAALPRNVALLRESGAPVEDERLAAPVASCARGRYKCGAAVKDQVGVVRGDYSDGPCTCGGWKGLGWHASLSDDKICPMSKDPWLPWQSRLSWAYKPAPRHAGTTRETRLLELARLCNGCQRPKGELLTLRPRGYTGLWWEDQRETCLTLRPIKPGRSGDRLREDRSVHKAAFVSSTDTPRFVWGQGSRVPPGKDKDLSDSCGKQLSLSSYSVESYSYPQNRDSGVRVDRFQRQGRDSGVRVNVSSAPRTGTVVLEWTTLSTKDIQGQWC